MAVVGCVKCSNNEGVMSNQQSVEELFASLGNSVTEAVEKHKNDPLRGYAELPEIKSGVAKLLTMEFYNDEGVLNFRATGEVVAPLYAEGGIPLKGLQTTVFAVLSRGDTERGVAAVLDVFRQMVGSDTLEKLLVNHGKSPEGLLVIAKGITATTKTNPIYFRFSNKFEENKNGKMDQKTGKPYPGRFWQRWQPKIDGYVPMMGGALPLPSPNGTGARHTTEHYDSTGKKKVDPAPWANKDNTPPPVGNPDPVPMNQPRSTAPDTFPLDDEPDVDDLVRRAVGGVDAAMGELEALALKLGYTADDVQDAAGWVEVGVWVKLDTPKGGTTTNSSTSSPFEVGKFVKFLPPSKAYPNDPTKRNLRPVDCEVVSVTGDKLTLKSVVHPDRTWEVEVSSPYVTMGETK